MTQVNKPDHDVVIELLPWYVNGTLNSAEQARVDRHLGACSECRQALLFYRQLDRQRSTSRPASDWQPSAAGFANILKDIDALESAGDINGIKASRLTMPGRLAKLSTWFKQTPRPVFWFMTLETLTLAALMLVVIGRLPVPPEPQLFQTLSNKRPPINAGLPRLSIVFSEDITEREIRGLLQAQHGQLVQGPSMLGVYTLQLAAGGERELQQAMTQLRSHPKVKLVEAVNGGARQ